MSPCGFEYISRENENVGLMMRLTGHFLTAYQCSITVPCRCVCVEDCCNSLAVTDQRTR